MWPVDGDAVRRLREQASLTQVQLAERSGVPQPTVSDIERGRVSRSSQENVTKLARALGVTADALLKRFKPAAGDAGPERRDPTLGELLEQLQSKVREIEQPVRVPVLGTRAHAHFVPGFPIDLGNFNIVRHISAGSEFAGRNVFGVDVAGDCLEPRVEDGDLALFEWGSRVGDGDYTVAVHEGVLIIKQARVVDGRVVALYDRYSDEPDGEEIAVNGHTTILGRVVQFRRDV